MCYQYSNCCQQINCKAIIKKYHCLLKEAAALLEKAENLTDTEVICGIYNTIKALKTTIDYTAKAGKKIVCANKLLNDSGCANDSCECKCLEKAAYKEFRKSYDLLLDTLNSLETALASIEASIEARKKAYKLYKKYVECIHETDNDDCCNDYIDCNY